MEGGGEACGCGTAEEQQQQQQEEEQEPTPEITVSVTPTTGGQFELAVTKTDSIESLKKLISKRLKVPKERICLLHRERQLREGTVQENQLVNGSRLTLLPSVETGLLAQRPEQSVMQALESLNDSQVNDFLSGKAPLNLTMRLGDHMMLIQLQLSTVAPSASRKGGSSSSSSSKSSSTQQSGGGGQGSPQPPPAPPPPPPPPPQQQPAPPPPPPQATTQPAATTATQATATTPDCKCEPKPVLDTKALAEASRNLTQTLKQLSSEVLTSKGDTIEEGTSPKRRQGAIIESMHHHGKGVYSGTFSGTLNPALQDRFGRPKRDISTIIHILNDLLCATPQYRAVSLAQEVPKPPATHPATGGAGETSLADSVENRATRGKMERLRLVLGQRRERRRAMRAQPYSSPTSHDHVTA